MRIALLAGLALLVLGGGAAGVFFYFKQPAEASIGGSAEHKAAKEAHKDARAAMDHAFVELDPLILPIIDERGVSQVVSLVIVIEVGDSHKASEVEKLSPRLKDAFIQDMYGMLNKHAALRGGVVQVGMIKERLREISQRVMGEDVVEDVLLQVVQQRKI